VGGVRRLVPLALAVAAAGGLLAAVWPGSSRVPSRVSASLTPRAPLFGDPVVARIEAPAGSRVDASFRPFAVRSTSRRGGTRVYTLECLTSACVPDGGRPRVVRLPSAVVRLPGAQPVAIAWPALRIGSRLAPGEALHASFWSETTPPRASSRLDPSTLGWILTALAGALLLGAGAWTASRLRPRRAPLRLVSQPDGTPLERALEAVERSVDEPPGRRRTALDALAVALGDEVLARRVSGLAWSEATPEPPAIRVVAHQAREAAR
jgi:hypothetical protein